MYVNWGRCILDSPDFQISILAGLLKILTKLVTIFKKKVFDKPYTLTGISFTNKNSFLKPRHQALTYGFWGSEKKTDTVAAL